MAITSTASSPTHRRLSARLDDEWDDLRRRRRAIAKVRSWRLTDPAAPPIADLDDVLELAGYRHRGQPDRSAPSGDATLARLVERSRHEPLAARIVLQRILPGLLAIAGAEQRRRPDVDALDLLVGEAWMAIVCYSVASRPTQIAARLLDDARHRAFTNPRRRRRVAEQPLRPYELTCPPFAPEPPLGDQLLCALVEATRQGVSAEDVRLLWGLVRSSSATALADELSVVPRTLRYRRDRAIERVRTALAAAA